jgi:hypothetical protein
MSLTTQEIQSLTQKPAVLEDFQYKEGYYFDRRDATTTRAISYLHFSLPLLILATAQYCVELVFHIVHHASHGAKPRLDGIPDILWLSRDPCIHRLCQR